MDKLIYTAMTGARQVMEQQATTANNLANLSTTGFRAQLDAFRAVPIVGDGLATRSFVVDATGGSDFRSGPIQHTGRDLDVAVQGDGWLSVQREDGSEAYTRNGSLKLSANGVLQTQSGLNVLGDGGPISIPPNVNVAIAKDGTVSSISTEGKATVSVLGRLKLVNPESSNLTRAPDGLFQTKDGSSPAADAKVVLAGGALEGSNVNVVDTMVNMISLARQFDIHMKLLQNAENNDTKATQIQALS